MQLKRPHISGNCGEEVVSGEEEANNYVLNISFKPITNRSNTKQNMLDLLVDLSLLMWNKKSQ